MPTIVKPQLLTITFLLLYAQLVHAAPASFPYVAEVTQEAVNVRAGQSTNFERLYQLKKDDEVIVLEKDFSWYKIQLPLKADVYIAEKYVKKLSSTKGVVSADKVNVRCGADTHFTVIGQVIKDQQVVIRDLKDGWYKIEPMEGHIGWVAEEFLRFKSQAVPARKTPTATQEDLTGAPEAAVAPTADQAKAAQAPVPNIPREKMVVQGVLMPQEAGNVPDVYYRIQDGEKVYLIKGMKFALDNFLDYTIRAEGLVEETSAAGTGYPLLNISKDPADSLTGSSMDIHMFEQVIKILLILFSAIVLHEVAHGWMANRLGDPTAKIAGRLSLNPLKHIDPIGTLLLPGILIALRLMGHDTFVFGWAKPVPVNFMRLRQPKRDMIWVGMAGPAINVAMAVGFAQLINVPMSLENFELVVLAIFINLLLAVFNMIPIPPLDGSRLVMGLLPEKINVYYMRLERYGILLVILFLYFGAFESLVLPVVDYFGNMLGVSFQ